MILSIIGAKIANPGGKIRWNLPILSTIQASSCGTNLIIVLVGNGLVWKNVGGVIVLVDVVVEGKIEVAILLEVEEVGCTDDEERGGDGGGGGGGVVVVVVGVVELNNDKGPRFVN